MLASYPLSSRPLAAAPITPRAFRVEALDGEYGFAAWSYSRQAKLNAWTWHGVGALGNINSWATLGNAVYVRVENDAYVYLLQPDVFLAEGDTNNESSSVEATTQWLDFGKPGKTKALEGMKFDGQNVTTLEVYVSENGGRTGELAATIDLSTTTGWTYNEPMIPLEEVGAATEFMLRFVCDGNEEAQINRFTVYYSEVQG